MAVASQGELTGFVFLILIFSAITLRYIVKDKTEVINDRFESSKSVVSGGLLMIWREILVNGWIGGLVSKNEHALRF